MHLLPVCFFLFLSKGCASAPSCAMLEMGDRVEIVTKLLRESYLDYPQLCECYGALSAEALWKELEEARMHWRLNETLLGKSGYLCMTPYVLQRRCELLALLNQLQLSYPRVKGMTMEVVSLRLQTIDLDAYPLLASQLRMPQGDLLLLLFCLSLLPQDARTLCQLWKDLVLPAAPLRETALFMDEDAAAKRWKRPDQTYLFLHFLSQLELNFKECLLLLKRDCGDHLRMSGEQLQHRYPLLSQRQIAFFVSHRGRDEYYSIQDYMRFADVCYETARQAMEQLAAQHWYRRRKIGKRFYYTTMVGQSDGVL